MKPLLLIIEGAQGVGKSTLTTQLRERMTSTNLMRLSGMKQKNEEAEWLSYRYHAAVLEMMIETHTTGLNWVLDRSFLSDKVYANLGFKDYTFETPYDLLCHKLTRLSHRFEVYLVILTTDEETFKVRLNRQKATYQAFDVQSSLNQQEQYLALANSISQQVNTFIIDTTNGDSYEKLMSALKEKGVLE